MVIEVRCIVCSFALFCLLLNLKEIIDKEKLCSILPSFIATNESVKLRDTELKKT